MELYLHSPYVVRAWYLVKHRGNITFTLDKLAYLNFALDITRQH
jgi:hypothetical protein